MTMLLRFQYFLNNMSKIALIIIGLTVLYSVTIIVSVACDDSALSKMSPCYWFYNQPITFFIALIVLLIILNKLVGLIINLKKGKQNDK